MAIIAYHHTVNAKNQRKSRAKNAEMDEANGKAKGAHADKDKTNGKANGKSNEKGKKSGNAKGKHEEGKPNRHSKETKRKEIQTVASSRINLPQLVSVPKTECLMFTPYLRTACVA